jgi:hypothetical protein
MYLAEIVELDGETQARVKILTGPLTGQEIVVPWGIIKSIGPIWRRFDSNDINTLPENLSRVEMQLINRRVFRGVYSRDLGWFTSIGSVMPADHDLMQKRWRYEVPDDLETYFRWIHERRRTAKPLKHRDVRAESFEAPRSKCHANVDRFVSLNANLNPVRGWMFITEDDAGHCRFEAHSVIEDNGELYDITLADQKECDQHPFIRHLGSDDQFFAVANDHPYLVYPTVTADEVMNTGGADDSGEIDE